MAGLQSPQPADVAQLVEHWLPKHIRAPDERPRAAANADEEWPEAGFPMKTSHRFEEGSRVEMA
jgi:hypothetical protein